MQINFFLPNLSSAFNLLLSYSLWTLFTFLLIGNGWQVTSLSSYEMPWWENFKSCVRPVYQIRFELFPLIFVHPFISLAQLIVWHFSFSLQFVCWWSMLKFTPHPHTGRYIYISYFSWFKFILLCYSPTGNYLVFCREYDSCSFGKVLWYKHSFKDEWGWCYQGLIKANSNSSSLLLVLVHIYFSSGAKHPDIHSPAKDESSDGWFKWVIPTHGQFNMGLSPLP